MLLLYMRDTNGSRLHKSSKCVQCKLLTLVMLIAWKGAYSCPLDPNSNPNPSIFTASFDEHYTHSATYGCTLPQLLRPWCSRTFTNTIFVYVPPGARHLANAFRVVFSPHCAELHSARPDLRGHLLAGHLAAMCSRSSLGGK